MLIRHVWPTRVCVSFPSRTMSLISTTWKKMTLWWAIITHEQEAIDESMSNQHKRSYKWNHRMFSWIGSSKNDHGDWTYPWESLLPKNDGAKADAAESIDRKAIVIFMILLTWMEVVRTLFTVVVMFASLCFDWASWNGGDRFRNFKRYLRRRSRKHRSTHFHANTFYRTTYCLHV